MTGHLANPPAIAWVLLSVFARPHWLPNRDEDEAIQSEPASHFSGRPYPGSQPQERLLWIILRVVRCTRVHKLGPRLVCPSSFSPFVKKSVDHLFYLKWFEIFPAVIFQTRKYSEFPRERLLVCRQVSLVVGLLRFRLQTGWSYSGIPAEYMKQLYRCDLVLRASFVRAGCTLGRWGWHLGRRFNGTGTGHEA